ncbi:MAG: DUF547 domain-containing protein [Arenimonas sp.]
MRRILFAFITLLIISSPLQAAFDRTHGQWDALLKQHVQWNKTGTASSVDYAGFAKDRAKFEQYLKSLDVVSRQEYSQWPLNEQQAFLINAYNAHTVQLILTRYPKLESIKDLGSLFSSPWKREFFSLLGEKRSLDDVEHKLLRGDKRYQEPRIHFAVNCASIGCPALRDEAYTGAKLASQLEDQTIRFLSDSSRNRFDMKTGKYSVSRIFDWYQKDFDQYTGGVKSFLIRYADKTEKYPAILSYIKNNNFTIDYFTYDWSLNKVR